VHKQQGMNLIELLLVLGIVGIITAAAIPVYDAYVIRTKVAGGLGSAGDAKFAVSETFLSEGAVASQAATGYTSPAATIDVASITIAGDGSGNITITYTAAAGGGTIVMEPTLVSGQQVSWSCTGGTLAAQYRPSECR
jgi:type IV pilus assembly protein PilA